MKDCKLVRIAIVSEIFNFSRFRKNFRFYCRLCTEPLFIEINQINKLSDRSQHLLKAHNKNPEEYECDICGMRKLLKSSLNDHLKTHITKIEKTFLCSTCGKTFKNRPVLLDHEALHTPFKFPCDLCDKVCVTEYRLMLHVNRIHKKISRSVLIQNATKNFC
jgi:DNA-directed RNA polymerase subunit RPC12/RpoP